MLVMRLGIPFATIGLLNTDKGVFPEYLRGFLFTAFTLVIQMSLLNLSILCLANAQLIYGIGVSIMSVNTPSILSRYMVRPSGNPITSLGNTARSIRALLPRRR